MKNCLLCGAEYWKEGCLPISGDERFCEECGARACEEKLAIKDFDAANVTVEERLWKDAPTGGGYYFVQNGIERQVVCFDLENQEVSHSAGICKLRTFAGWNWWGPINEPSIEVDNESEEHK